MLPETVRTIVGLLFGVGMFLLLLWCAYVVHDGVRSPAFAMTLALGLFGVSLGWLIGLLASPYNDTELQRFATYAGVLSAFLTGYVAGKLDPIITRVLAKDPIRVDLVAFLRLTTFATSVVLGTLGSYAYRAYLFGPASVR